MKKISKMLICLVICFMVTALVANGAVYRKKSAKSNSTTFKNASAAYTFNTTFEVKNNINYLYNWNAVLNLTCSAADKTKYSATSSNQRIYNSTNYVDFYGVASIYYLSNDTLIYSPNSTKTLHARVYK